LYSLYVESAQTERRQRSSRILYRPDENGDGVTLTVSDLEHVYNVCDAKATALK